MKDEIMILVNVALIALSLLIGPSCSQEDGLLLSPGVSPTSASPEPQASPETNPNDSTPAEGTGDDGGTTGGGTTGSTAGGGGKGHGKNPDKGSTGNQPTRSPEGESPDYPTKAEMGECSKFLDAEVESITVASNQPKVTIHAREGVAALRITGNQSSVDLRIEGSGGKGVCVFLAGNRSRLTAVVSTTLEKVLVVARGNNAVADFTVEKDAEIKLLQADLAGSHPTLNIRGEGSYPCATVVEHGNSPTLNCAN